MTSRYFMTFIAVFALTLGYFAPINEVSAGQRQGTATANLVQGGGLPDLKIHGYKFLSADTRTVRVMVANVGKSKAGAMVLRLTVRRVDGKPLGKTIDIPVAGLDANTSQWIAIDAASILPKAADLATSTFKVEVDAAKRVRESNESNNRRWHNM